MSGTPTFEKFELTPELFDTKKEINFENLYNLCTAELSLQQSKRDQIIAFYVAIASFLIPTAYELELSLLFRAAAFALVAFIGAMLCRVVVRYRVYKEVYWVTSRTIAALMRAKPERLEKAFVQKVFAVNLRKSMPSVIACDYAEKDGARVPTRIRRFATVIKQQNSAETMLYMVIVVMPAVSAFLAGYTLCGGISAAPAWLPAVCGAVIFLFVVYLAVRSYTRALNDVYTFCFDRTDASFNKVYAKAWFLHGLECGAAAPEKAQ